jgi:prepilin-type N-terminal cleavage/methylation domain-containing protein
LSEKGYTLAETLVALMVVGIAMAGLARGVTVLNSLQKGASSSVGRQWDLRRAREGLTALLEAQGPFLTGESSSADFNGTARDFKFLCGGALRCGASLTNSDSGMRLQMHGPSGAAVIADIPGVSRAAFAYGSDRSFGPDWPTTSDKPRALRWIFVGEDTDKGLKPLFSVPIAVDQAADCQFDTITRTCRKRGE